MRKTISRTLSFLLIPALLLSLFLSACMPGNVEQTTPGSTTTETTAATEPPMTAGEYTYGEHRQMYEQYFADHFDPELRDFVYSLIEDTEWPGSNWSFPRLEEFYDEYLMLESHGKKILPYILSYIEEEHHIEYLNSYLLVIANKMLGYDKIKGDPLASTDPDRFTYRWRARQLWEEVFTP